MSEELDFSDDEILVGEAILAQRKIDEYLFREASMLKKGFNQKEWLKVFQKRVQKISEVNMGAKSGKSELRKRILQQAAMCILALRVMDEESLNEKDTSSNKN